MASSVNMLFFGIVCLVACTFCRAADDDKCQSFAGGSVFPQETRRTSGHAIQWSQAVSKFCIQRASFPVLSKDWVETWSLFTKANRCVSYWYLWHYFYLQEVFLLGSIHLEETVVFYVFVFQKLTCIHWHNNTAAHVRICVLWGSANAFLIYIFF